jgi:hypothetical protein
MQNSAQTGTKKRLLLVALGAAAIVGLPLGWVYTSPTPVLGYASCKRMSYGDELDIQPRRLYAGSDVGGMGMFKYRIVFPAPPGYAQKGAEVHPNVATPAFDGWLLGGNRGEFGGELIYQAGYDGAVHKLLDENVEDLYKMPFGFVATTGLAHMGYDGGALYLITRTGKALPKASKISDLPAAPMTSWFLTSGDLLVNTSAGSVVLTADRKIRSIRCLPGTAGGT